MPWGTTDFLTEGRRERWSHRASGPPRAAPETAPDHAGRTDAGRRDRRDAAGRVRRGSGRVPCFLHRPPGRGQRGRRGRGRPGDRARRQVVQQAAQQRGRALRRGPRDQGAAVDRGRGGVRAQVTLRPRRVRRLDPGFLTLGRCGPQLPRRGPAGPAHRDHGGQVPADDRDAPVGGHADAGLRHVGGLAVPAPAAGRRPRLRPGAARGVPGPRAEFRRAGHVDPASADAPEGARHGREDPGRVRRLRVQRPGHPRFGE